MDIVDVLDVVHIPATSEVRMCQNQRHERHLVVNIVLADGGILKGDDDKDEAEAVHDEDNPP